MRTVDDFRSYAARAWARRFPAWLGALAEDVPAEPLSWPLHPPTEREALVAPDRAAAWATAWRRFGESEGVEVRWATRSWPSLGHQVLPARVSCAPAAVARIAGQADGWGVSEATVDTLRRGWPDVAFGEAVQSAARALVKMTIEDVPKLARVLGWLVAHPGSGLWERELPVAGVDTKWFERHRAVVEPLAAAITGEATGLRRHGVGFRVRILDPGSWSGAAEFTVGLDELVALALTPAYVLVCENLTSVSTLPELSATVAVHGMGFAAPSLAEVGWIRDAAVVYWGDLDTYGFQILGSVRAALPQTRSVLMDASTLEAHREFAVPEPRPYRGEIGYLTVAELEALALLRADDLRLEQERIPRAAAAGALGSAVGVVPYAAGQPRRLTTNSAELARSCQFGRAIGDSSR
ncbi:MAG: hypothetical protein IPJ61_02145 [Tessaracoccus sp.]|uniref:Wadjet anti-phage system protein JetD domain-containing protein n=1 Tax=Tessaracoccus sp. TaxID=1971211 RepID=UPI001EC38A05|nr:DUF3322 and DUF2220 domain-containing protein [Tessaracoccus sp.]MBK7819892.1 hypothetical protein [Tessaracoccus sp.]